MQVIVIEHLFKNFVSQYGTLLSKQSICVASYL